MDVGVYVDGFNLYYGARRLCGGNVPGWRWLDLRGLASSLIPPMWPGATVTRVVYCTARIDGAENPSGHADQDAYLKALNASGSIDWIEHGYYVSRVKKAPLATEGPRGRPVLTRSNWPLMIRDSTDAPVGNASFMVSHARREEKGSDVNVAAHLLLDVLTPNIDAAIVVSNDSDLRYPIKESRLRVPVGTVNPSPNYTAGALKGDPADGVGNHWWRKLSATDITGNQLGDPAGGIAKPAGW